MIVPSLLWVLLLVSVQDVSAQEETYEDEYEYEDSQPLNCSTDESITDGEVKYSQGGLEGSVLTYHCGPGKYPFPISSRTCGADGAWSPMRLASGARVSKARCKDLLCPAQLQLDNGDFWPRDQWFRVGMTQSFSCQEGFTLYGSAERNCTISGGWTGRTPICDNLADDCRDPGTPPGAHRAGDRFRTGEKVIYSCQTGLDLLGSSERLCLENREWSGSMPRCQGPNMFDSLNDVAQAMAGSLGGLMDVFSPDSEKKGENVGFGRTIRTEKGSRINIYILLDTSGSIKEEDFEKSLNATVALIKKLDSYEVKMKFHVLSFASKVIDVVNITDEGVSSVAGDVIGHLKDFDYKSHGRKTGTNLYAALHRVYEMINVFKQHSARNFFNQTQNIIIIETDGYSNTGKNPKGALTRIRNLLGYHNIGSPDQTEETLLDVYVFGVGEQVNKQELNSLASHKRGEEHLFIMKDYTTLGDMFNSMISDKSVTICGIAQEESSKKDEVYTQPWHVTMNKANEREHLCSGSLVSPNWVLTAAHCFGKVAKNVSEQVDIKIGGVTVRSKHVIMHHKYNTAALKHKLVDEFYDYDVALVQLSKKIHLSHMARPICLPCTVPGERALKKVNSTCEEHRKILIPHKQTPVFFINKKNQRKKSHIHTESERSVCVEKAQLTLNESSVATLDEYVPDTFLCSGGTKDHRDAIACKGDSGGSLFLQNRNRYFQLGVVSWGTIDVCKPLRGYSADQPPPDARDFHIDLFKILPWLKQHLGKEIVFLPEVKKQDPET